MKLFNLFKNKENVEVKEVEEPKVETHIIEQPQMIKVKCVKNVTLVNECRKIKIGEVLELTKDRAIELQEKGFIKIIGG